MTNLIAKFYRKLLARGLQRQWCAASYGISTKRLNAKVADNNEAAAEKKERLRQPPGSLVGARQCELQSRSSFPLQTILRLIPAVALRELVGNFLPLEQLVAAGFAFAPDHQAADSVPVCGFVITGEELAARSR